MNFPTKKITDWDLILQLTTIRKLVIFCEFCFFVFFFKLHIFYEIFVKAS